MRSEFRKKKRTPNKEREGCEFKGETGLDKRGVDSAIVLGFAWGKTAEKHERVLQKCTTADTGGGPNYLVGKIPIAYTLRVKRAANGKACKEEGEHIQERDGLGTSDCIRKFKPKT